MCAEVSAVTELITFFWFLLTLYSCGNVIVLVIVHFINNWFMMILVAVYVYLKINAMKSPSWPKITPQSLKHPKNMGSNLQYIYILMIH